jgi:hypothetical protein
VRDLYEAKKGIGRVPAPILEQAPRFHELAERNLKTATHLAESTRKDRELLLGEGSQLIAYFGDRRVDQVSRGWPGHLGRTGHQFRKVSLEKLLEEFPDWPSTVSEVSTVELRGELRFAHFKTRQDHP